eukprot:scaffold131667_cov57-Phaeocystis_antarctica.AAC.1
MAPPPTWAELGLPDDDPMRRVPPPSRAELAYRRNYAKMAAGPSQPYPPAAGPDSSEAAGPAPSDARLPSQPPGKGWVVARSSHSLTGFRGTASARLSSASTACGEDTPGAVLAGATSSGQEQLAAEALADLAMDEGAPAQRRRARSLFKRVFWSRLQCVVRHGAFDRATEAKIGLSTFLGGGSYLRPVSPQLPKAYKQG